MLVFFLYFGGMMFFDNFNLVTTPLYDKDGIPTDKLKLNTIIFHSFFLMSWFNTFNSRIVGENDINIFSTMFNNKFLWIIMILELVLQLIMINPSKGSLLSALAGTHELTLTQHIVCWSVGAFTLVVNIIGKKIPLQSFKKLSEKFDLESDKKTQAIDRFNNVYSGLLNMNQLEKNDDGEKDLRD